MLFLRHVSRYGLGEGLRLRSTVAAGILLALLILLTPNALAWESRPEITWVQDSQESTVLEIKFNFQEMSSPPAPDHFPPGFMIRYREPNQAEWKELDYIQIRQIPRTTLFTVTAKIPNIDKPRVLAIQTALDCSIHGLSNWSPEWYTATTTVARVTTTTVSTTVTTSSVITLSTTVTRTTESTTTTTISTTITSVTTSSTTLTTTSPTTVTVTVTTTTTKTTAEAVSTVTSEVTKETGLPAEITYAAVGVSVIAVAAAALLAARRRR